MENIYSRIKKLNVELKKTLNDKINLTDYDIDLGNESSSALLPKYLAEFYKENSHLKIEWETRELVGENSWKPCGRINILKADLVLSDWKEVVYFDGDSQELKQFKIVDNFVPEAHCGFLLNENNSDAMYYHESGEPELVPLGVDFSGYLELMFMARGFWYWQQAVLLIKNGRTSTTAAGDFKTYMPQIFPDFKWEEFVGLWERVRIK